MEGVKYPMKKQLLIFLLVLSKSHLSKQIFSFLKKSFNERVCSETLATQDFNVSRSSEDIKYLPCLSETRVRLRLRARFNKYQIWQPRVGHWCTTTPLLLLDAMVPSQCSPQPSALFTSRLRFGEQHGDETRPVSRPLLQITRLL